MLHPNLAVVAGAFLTLALPLASGCDRDPAPPPAPPMPVAPAGLASVARALGVDAASLEVPVDPLSPPGDLRADIERFSSLDACVIEHAQTDPFVGDALRAIGYDTFLRDACRMLEAMKTKSRAKCTAIDAGGLRARCEAQVAMVMARPEDCPWEVPDTPAQGREATCIAVASRDLRLCAAAARGDRSTCEALVTRSDERCTDDRTRAACKRDVTRWKGVLEAPQTGLAAISKAHAHVELRGSDGTADPAQVDTDLTQDIARGVVAMLAKDGMHLAFGVKRELGVTSFAPAPSARPRLVLGIVVQPKASSAVVEHAEIGVPGASTIVFPGGRCDCKVKVTRMGSARGDDVEITLEGTVGVTPHVFKIKSQITTFLRDVVEAPAAPRR